MMAISAFGTPSAISCAATAWARRIDSPRLYSGVPEVSVYPFTLIRVTPPPVAVFAASLITPRARSVRVALSQSKKTRKSCFCWTVGTAGTAAAGRTGGVTPNA